MATLIPDNGVAAIKTADVDGVQLAGFLIDAGATNSDVLAEIGPAGSSASHAVNPTALHDVYFRVGGAVPGKATTSLIINSNNELPYEPPNQAAWMNGTTRGYAAYKVADSVTTHEAWGLGSYCVFTQDQSIVAERSFEVPDKPGVKFHNMVIVSLGGQGTINHVINNVGGPANSTTNTVYLTNYP